MDKVWSNNEKETFIDDIEERLGQQEASLREKKEKKLERDRRFKSQKTSPSTETPTNTVISKGNKKDNISSILTRHISDKISENKQRRIDGFKQRTKQENKTSHDEPKNIVNWKKEHNDNRDQRKSETNNEYHKNTEQEQHELNSKQRYTDKRKDNIVFRKGRRFHQLPYERLN